MSFESYIKPQLLTKTTKERMGCISFDSYIKPQRTWLRADWSAGCISFDSYIKPQLRPSLLFQMFVVYLLIPTSNHNIGTDDHEEQALYIFWFLHQTTTREEEKKRELYIFWFLHQTTTQKQKNIYYERLYIFWFLHQTTTGPALGEGKVRCISFDSYIKPQRVAQHLRLI